MLALLLPVYRRRMREAAERMADVG